MTFHACIEPGREQAGRGKAPAQTGQYTELGAPARRRDGLLPNSRNIYDAAGKAGRLAVAGAHERARGRSTHALASEPKRRALASPSRAAPPAPFA
ncbi:hypothetical protein V4E86_19865 [Burkholderia pseudomallei]|uniref:Uncharacterized protein n=4 Tax=pseudomallei group TaxID=111527 RepID=A0A0H3I0J0_BURP2|nr:MULTISPECIES: hypothetical protein [pseudomallei group]ABM49003.1 hypothetical protein BMASAVP1_1104 [Burkholderia mallei SAVP1]ABN88424.1 hypothetical protein BURPS668_A3250 [Burkholderia pseudomallei 668]ABN94081.1 hypothetical protein BURPS1106A_A3135 [Burkholderia pseudomallei 1106a]ABO03632.1 hypothetical protein BMA10247_A2368 [Burkholderia mallei NCTC 10247]AFI70705.1 hypothetical protein BP1026B_II2495 [Burkholderia pseudomallei 1026b]